MSASVHLAPATKSPSLIIGVRTGHAGKTKAGDETQVLIVDATSARPKTKLAAAAAAEQEAEKTLLY